VSGVQVVSPGTVAWMAQALKMGHSSVSRGDGSQKFPPKLHTNLDQSPAYNSEYLKEIKLRAIERVLRELWRVQARCWTGSGTVLARCTEDPGENSVLHMVCPATNYKVFQASTKL